MITLQRRLTGADSLLAMRAIGQMVFPLSPLDQLEHGFKVFFPNWQQHLKKYPKLRYGNGWCFFSPSYFQVPQKEVGQDACQDVLMPSTKFSDLVMVHPQFGFGFFEALLNGP